MRVDEYAEYRRFGARMGGVGPRWKAVEALFEAEKRRIGFRDDEEPSLPRTARFERPPRQRSLFD
jgi:hypothetical protein